MAYYDDIEREIRLACPKCDSGDIEYDEGGYWYCIKCFYSFFDPAYDLTDGDDPSVLEWREEQRYEDGYYDTYDGSGLNDE